MVDSYAGADAVLKRCTIGGFSDGSVSGAASWGILTWQLATLTVEDCLIEDAELIGISACHASTVSVLGCTVQGCRVGGLLVNEEAQMTVQSCLLRDNMAALVAGTEAFLASMELVGNVVHGRVWHDGWGGHLLQADKPDEVGDGLPLFLGTWTDRGRIPDADPEDVWRYVRRVRRNTWSKLPVRLTRADMEQMGLEAPPKHVAHVVGRPGKLVEVNNEYVNAAELEEDLVGIGVALNTTSKGEVVVVGLLVGQPAHLGGVEVGDVIFAVDSVPVWLAEEVSKRCAGKPGTCISRAPLLRAGHGARQRMQPSLPSEHAVLGLTRRRKLSRAGTTVTLGLLRGPYRGEIEITITRKFIARIPLTGPTGCPFVEAPRDSGRRRMRFDSASDVSDRLVPVTAAAAAAASSSGALQTPRGDTGGEKAASVASVASAGGLPTNATAPASLLPERERNREFSGPEMFAMADDGEGEVGLMKDLQRDPWAVLHEFLCPRTRANMPVCL